MKKDNTSQLHTVKRVLKRVGRYKPLIFITLVSAAVTVAGALYIPILTGRAIDHIAGPGRVDLAGTAAVLLRMGITIAVTAIFQWIMNVCNNRITFSVVRDIRKEAFERIEDLPLNYIDAHSHGDTVSRVIADADQFSDGLLMGFTQLFTSALTILGTLIFMLTINIWITLVVVLLTPLSFFVAGFIAKRSYKMFALQSEERGKQTSLINEVISNQKIVQAFSHEESSLREFDEINNRLEKYSLNATFFSSLTNPSTRFVNSLVYAGVGVTGAIAAIRGFLTVGQLVSFLSYANQYTKPFNEISGVITELQNAIACAARLLDLIDEPSQKPDSADPVRLEISGSTAEVEFDDVSFSYTKERPLIRS